MIKKPLPTFAERERLAAMAAEVKRRAALQAEKLAASRAALLSTPPPPSVMSKVTSAQKQPVNLMRMVTNAQKLSANIPPTNVLSKTISAPKVNLLSKVTSAPLTPITQQGMTDIASLPIEIQKQIVTLREAYTAQDAKVKGFIPLGKEIENINKQVDEANNNLMKARDQKKNTEAAVQAAKDSLTRATAALKSAEEVSAAEEKRLADAKKMRDTVGERVTMLRMNVKIMEIEMAKLKQVAVEYHDACRKYGLKCDVPPGLQLPFNPASLKNVIRNNATLSKGGGRRKTKKATRRRR
jgi:hypothetical protein